MANVRELDTGELSHLGEMLYHVTEKHDTCVAFHEKRGGFYQHISYGRLHDEAEALGTDLGRTLPHGARVLVVGRGGYLWALSFLALSCGGFTPVLTDETLSGEALTAIAEDAGVVAVMCDAVTLARLSTVTDLPLISFDTVPSRIERGRAAVLAGDRGFGEAPLAEFAAVFYTAVGKGFRAVSFSHSNICAALGALREALPLSCADTFLSVLPPSNAYECVVGLLLPLSCGASVAFGEGLGALMRNMREIHPTHIVAVPYLAERLYDKFWQLVRGSGKETSVRRAIAVSDPVRPLSARRALKEKLLAAAREPFGGSLRTLLVVGGILPKTVCKGLRQIGILAAQGYGASECAGLVALTTGDAYRDGTVGKPLASVAVDIADKQSDGRGEIRLSGAALGGEAAEDGWLYTGDLGKIDEDGFLHVIGKRKNCIERAGGIRVSPEELEEAIMQSPLVKEAAVVGVLNREGTDREPTAFVYPNTAYIGELIGKEPDESEQESAVSEWLCELNAALPEEARIVSFALTDSAIPKNSEGHILRAKLAAELEAAEQRNRRDQ